MIRLDEDLRLGLEESIRSVLREQGIEPNLEIVLSYIAGNIFGLAMAWYASKYQRQMNEDEGTAVLRFTKRRAYELREAFIKTRMKNK